MQSSSKQLAKAQLQKHNIGNFCELDCSPDKSMKNCYRTEALKLHPDRNGGDAAKFMAMKARYDNIDDGAKGLTCAKYTELGFKDYKVAIREFIRKNEGKIQNPDFLAFLKSVINNKDVYKQVVRLEPLPEKEVVLMLEDVAGVQKGGSRRQARQLGGAVVNIPELYEGPKWGEPELNQPSKSNIKKYLIGGLLLVFLGAGVAARYAAPATTASTGVSIPYGSTVRDHPIASAGHPTAAMVPGYGLSNSNRESRQARLNDQFSAFRDFKQNLNEPEPTPARAPSSALSVVSGENVVDHPLQGSSYPAMRMEFPLSGSNSDRRQAARLDVFNVDSDFNRAGVQKMAAFKKYKPQTRAQGQSQSGSTAVANTSPARLQKSPANQKSANQNYTSAVGPLIGTGNGTSDPHLNLMSPANLSGSTALSTVQNTSPARLQTSRSGLQSGMSANQNYTPPGSALANVQRPGTSPARQSSQDLIDAVNAVRAQRPGTAVIPFGNRLTPKQIGRVAAGQKLLTVGLQN